MTVATMAAATPIGLVVEIVVATATAAVMMMTGRAAGQTMLADQEMAMAGPEMTVDRVMATATATGMAMAMATMVDRAMATEIMMVGPEMVMAGPEMAMVTATEMVMAMAMAMVLEHPTTEIATAMAEEITNSQE